MTEAETSTTKTNIGDRRSILTEELSTFDFDGDGYITHPDGRYAYRPLRFAEQGRVVVCERVR